MDSNGTMLSNQMDDLFESGLSELWYAVDGATKEAHEKYRQGTNFEKVKQTLRKLIKKREELRKSKPEIKVQTIAFQHNIDQLEEIGKWAKRIGADGHIITPTSLGSGYLEESKKDLAKEWLPNEKGYQRFYSSEEGPRRRSWGDCPWIYKAMVFWNGDITKCCYDLNGALVFGNVFEESFEKCWKSQRHRRIIKSALENEFSLCQLADCR